MGRATKKSFFNDRAVVHVVQDSAVRSLQNTHASLMIKVKSGLWGQSKTPIKRCQFARVQRGQSVSLVSLFFDKVRVAGSNPALAHTVVRSERTRRLEARGRLLAGSWGSRSSARTTSVPQVIRFVRPCADAHYL